MTTVPLLFHGQLVSTTQHASVYVFHFDVQGSCVSVLTYADPMTLLEPAHVQRRAIVQALYDALAVANARLVYSDVQIAAPKQEDIRYNG